MIQHLLTQPLYNTDTDTDSDRHAGARMHTRTQHVQMDTHTLTSNQIFR